jgi:hypothetical protein
MKLRHLTLAIVAFGASQAMAAESTMYLNHIHYDTAPALKCTYSDTATTGAVSGAVRLGYVGCKNSIKGQTYSLVSSNGQQLKLLDGDTTDVWAYNIYDTAGKILVSTANLTQAQVEYLAVMTAGDTTPKGGVWQDTWTLDVVTN